MRRLLIASILLLANCAPPPDDLRSRVERAPNDVEDFIVRRSSCNHFMGEYPYDEERAQFLNENIEELRCASLAEDERPLLVAYRDDPAVLRLLAETEDILAW